MTKSGTFDAHEQFAGEASAAFRAGSTESAIPQETPIPILVLASLQKAANFVLKKFDTVPPCQPLVNNRSHSLGRVNPDIFVSNVRSSALPRGLFVYGIHYLERKAERHEDEQRT
jgi:hypothetical protein